MDLFYAFDTFSSFKGVLQGPLYLLVLCLQCGYSADQRIEFLFGFVSNSPSMTFADFHNNYNG
jgi:hypothetical protein